MNLIDFIITNAKAAGLDDNEIGGIIQSARRKLPGNVPEDKHEDQLWNGLILELKTRKIVI